MLRDVNDKEFWEQQACAVAGCPNYAQTGVVYCIHHLNGAPRVLPDEVQRTLGRGKYHVPDPLALGREQQPAKEFVANPLVRESVEELARATDDAVEGAELLAGALRTNQYGLALEQAVLCKEALLELGRALRSIALI